ncbi:hypothetical protein ACP4OV_023987 [Aristida adscensionis]
MESGGGGVAEGFKACAAMAAAQCIYAAMMVWAKAAFGRGTSPVVFVVYRQAFAAVALAPVAIIAKRRRLKEMGLGVTGFLVVFVTALIGVTVNQFLCYQALHLVSPSLTMALTNLIPAITFVMAAAAGQERVRVTELSSIAKILGTVVCVGGAATMAFFKGPKLVLSHSHGASSSIVLQPSSSRKWAIGVLLQVCSCSCWSLWLILQAPICKSYADPLTLSAWTCLLSALQSAAVSFFVLPSQSAWKLGSIFEWSSCIFAVSSISAFFSLKERYSVDSAVTVVTETQSWRIRFFYLRSKGLKGAFGSGVGFFLQAWCISARGPLYSAMFTPLGAVITTVAVAILHEALHVGSLLGAVAIIAGLYVVLWGKAQDLEKGRVPTQGEDLAKADADSESQLDTEMEDRRSDLKCTDEHGQHRCTV